jgi:hypothetical protein
MDALANQARGHATAKLYRLSYVAERMIQVILLLEENEGCFWKGRSLESNRQRVRENGDFVRQASPVCEEQWCRVHKVLV